MSRPFLLGVLGGMGPLATVDFMHKLLRATPATHDGGADNPAPAKPRARRTRTRKTSGSDAQAQSE